MYHSVLLVRGDGEELWWVRHRRVLHRLSGGLDRPEGLKEQQTARRREEENGFSQRWRKDEKDLKGKTAQAFGYANERILLCGAY